MVSCFYSPYATADGSLRPDCSNRVATGARLRLEANPTDSTKQLPARVGGRELVIAEHVLAAWPIRRGCQIAYSGRDGAGGLENEGQSLWIYEVATGRRRKVTAAYFPIDQVIELDLLSVRTALLVQMHDSDLGASHVAVVDPDEEWPALLRGFIFPIEYR